MRSGNVFFIEMTGRVLLMAENIKDNGSQFTVFSVIPSTHASPRLTPRYIRGGGTCRHAAEAGQLAGQGFGWTRITALGLRWRQSLARARHAIGTHSTTAQGTTSRAISKYDPGNPPNAS